MKTKLLLLIILFSVTSIFSQTEEAYVYFTDKPSAATFLASPETMFTQRALDRRIKQNISIDIKDVPLEVSYVAGIAGTTGISVLAKSKWMNALHIEGDKSTIDNLLLLPYVDSIEYMDRSLNASSKTSKAQKTSKKNKWDLETKSQVVYDYGNAVNQITQLNAEVLHENDFTGEGVYIAVLDTSFPNVDTNLAFKNMRNNSRLLGGYNFVNRNTDFYTNDFSNGSHGALVLSTMAGYLENGVDGATTNYVGTAPNASYYLFATEKSTGDDIRLEESLWVEAAERADSLGVDIINTSLGYADFYGNTSHNYVYADMDGQTTFITRGAEIAFERGMILVTSAGNESGSTWNYITAPADADSVLTVGAVSSSGTIASFSSYGPTADGRIKPNVCALGQGSYFIHTDGNIYSGNGTSFSSPILAGAVACLWQAFPTKTNSEIIQLVKESGHLYPIPDSNNQMGYGIPDFESIYNTVLSTSDDVLNVEDFSVYPNPVKDIANINFPSKENGVNVSVFNILGKIQLQQLVKKDKPSIDLTKLPRGLYIFKLTNGSISSTFKVLKN